MTFQEAQAQFSALVGRAKLNMSSGELVQIQRDFISLQDRLPISAEFDVIANAIAEFTPRLTGQIVQAVLDSLKSREGTIREASTLLTQVGNKAKADARTLTLEQPKLVAAGLSEALAKIQELHGTARAGNLEQTASKAEALATLVEHIRGTIKVV